MSSLGSRSESAFIAELQKNIYNKYQMLQVLTLNVAKIILTVTITVLTEKCCHILKTSAFQINQLCKHTHVTNITYAC